MISISNLYEGIDQIMSFCRGREELSYGKNIIRNTYIYDKVIVILLIVSENFYVTFFAKKIFLQSLSYQSQSKYGFLRLYSRYFYMIR